MRQDSRSRVHGLSWRSRRKGAFTVQPILERLQELQFRVDEALARHNDKTDYAAVPGARLRTGRNLVDRAPADFRAAIEQLPGLT